MVYSINYHRAKDSKSSGKTLVKPVKDLKADGKNSVVFTLQEGNADFPMIMSDYHLAIVPKDYKDFDTGMGTGAYILQEWKPGVRAVTKRNPNFFKENAGFFDEVEIIYINDVNARTNALKTGQIDA